MDVEKLTDLEIKKHIAHIEGLITETAHGYDCCAFTEDKKDESDRFAKYMAIPYDPLTNDALCYQLMLKYDVQVQKRKGFRVVVINDPELNFLVSIAHENPNKAICLVIIKHFDIKLQREQQKVS